MSTPSDSPTEPEPAKTGQLSSEQLYDEAQALYVPYKTRVNAAQREVFDGEWQITTYGDFPQMCQSETGQRDDTYQFVTSVHLAEPAIAIGDQLADSIAGLADRLESDGWSDVKVLDVSTENAESMTVTASDASKHVEFLTVNFHGGFDGGSPWVILKASSECGDGRSLDLMEMMFPDVELPEEPQTMTPDGSIRFGFDANGQPMMLDGTSE